MRNREVKIYTEKDHTFVICAYGKSQFLEECILSLKGQSVPSNIIMVTSTPNEMIGSMAERYDIPLYVNEGKKGIAGDWNYAYSICGTELVTLAHQDDIYEPEYAEHVLHSVSYRKDPLIVFTDYGELREGKKVNKNRLLRIKRIMLMPLKVTWAQRSRWIRRRILSFGSAISCPTVTFVKGALPKEIFREGYKSDLDWQAWERLSKMQGEFIYCPEICMYHRIHEGSATTSIIADRGRRKEDLEMFSMFWPRPIAKLIARAYCMGERSNQL